MFLLAEGTISKKMRAEEMKNILSKHGINSGGITEENAGKLIQLNEENLQIQAAKLIVDNKLTGGGAAPIFREINEKKTIAARMGVLAEWQEKFSNQAESKPNEKHKSERRNAFLKLLTSMEKCIDKRTSLNQLQITATIDKDNAKKRLRKFAAAIERLLCDGSP